MTENDKIQLYENQPIRTAWDEENEEWYFSIVDVVSVLSDSKDANAYWRKLKQRLKEEGNESCRWQKKNDRCGKYRTTLTYHSSYSVKKSRTIQGMVSTGRTRKNRGNCRPRVDN